MFDRIDDQYLGGGIADFVDDTEVDLVRRWSGFREWLDGRLRNGIDPYSKFTAGPIAPVCVAGTRDGRAMRGINFASQEYLALASHAAVHRAAKDAIDEYGVHSAGSAALMGNTKLSR